MEKTGKSELVGIVTGTTAGLGTITPASVSVGALGAIVEHPPDWFVTLHVDSSKKNSEWMIHLIL